MSDNNYKLCSIEGVNGVGKGVLAERALYAMEAIAVQGYRDFHLNPFRTAFINEPPDLPLTDFAGHPGVLKEDGSLSTWRDVLKHGKFPEILEMSSSGTNREQRFAEGFLTARGVLEDFMRNKFQWDFDSRLPSFIKMVGNLGERLWKVDGYTKLPFDRMVIKDRGSGSTAVFQGQDPWVRELMEEMYAKEELQREDLTIIVMPSNFDNWANGGQRENDVDVHDSAKERQYQLYKNMRRDWARVFSKEIVYLENDPLGTDFDLGSLGALMPILFTAIERNNQLYWFDRGEGINSVKLNMNKLRAQLMRTMDSHDDSEAKVAPIPSTFYEDMTQVCGSAQVVYTYGDIPLSYVSGDIGVVQVMKRFADEEFDLEFILVEDLSKKVEKYRFNGFRDRTIFLDQYRDKI